MTTEEQIAKLEARITSLEETVISHQQALTRMLDATREIHNFQQHVIAYLKSLNNESEFPGSGSPNSQNVQEEQEGEN